MNRRCFSVLAGIAPSDLPVEKLGYDAFWNSRLEWVLRRAGVRRLLVAGIVLWIASPLVYVFRARTLTSPLVTDTEQQRFRRVQLAANALSFVSMLLLLAYLLTDEIVGMRLVGLDRETSFFRPWEVAQYLGDYLGRSLFITVLAADFFMRVNGSIWQSVGRFTGTPQAEEYDRLMQELKGAD